jgi:hypothetical protein
MLPSSIHRQLFETCATRSKLCIRTLVHFVSVETVENDVTDTLSCLDRLYKYYFSDIRASTYTYKGKIELVLN